MPVPLGEPVGLEDADGLVTSDRIVAVTSVARTSLGGGNWRTWAWMDSDGQYGGTAVDQNTDGPLTGPDAILIAVGDAMRQAAGDRLTVLLISRWPVYAQVTELFADRSNIRVEFAHQDNRTGKHCGGLPKYVQDLACEIMFRAIGLEETETIEGTSVAKPLPEIVVGTDASAGRTGQSAWGWYDEKGHYGHGFSSKSIVKGESAAIAAALAAHKKRRPVLILTDSALVVGALLRDPALRDRVLPLPYGVWGGGRKGKKGATVTSELAAAMRSRPLARIGWVRGHNGHPLNEIADRLAVAARRTDSAQLTDDQQQQIIDGILADGQELLDGASREDLLAGYPDSPVSFPEPVPVTEACSVDVGFEQTEPPDTNTPTVFESSVPASNNPSVPIDSNSDDGADSYTREHEYVTQGCFSGQRHQESSKETT